MAGTCDACGAPVPDGEENDYRDLPRGAFRPIVIKNRYDPEIEEREVPTIEDLRNGDLDL